MSLTAPAEDALGRLRWRPLRQGDRVRPGEVVLCGEGDEVELAFSRPLMKDHLGIDADYVLPELFEKRSEQEVFLPVPASSLMRVAIPPGLGASGPHPDARARTVKGQPRVTADLREIATLFVEQEIFAHAERRSVATRAPAAAAAPALNVPRRIGIAPFPRMGPKSGVVIERALEGGPAARAGLSTGDKILAVDGQPVGDIWELKRVVESGHGPTMVLSVQRKGATQPALVTLELEAGAPGGE